MPGARPGNKPLGGREVGSGREQVSHGLCPGRGSEEADLEAEESESESVAEGLGVCLQRGGLSKQDRDPSGDKWAREGQRKGRWDLSLSRPSIEEEQKNTLLSLHVVQWVPPSQSIIHTLRVR